MASVVLPQFALIDLQFSNLPSTPQCITGILFLMFGLGRTGVPRGGSEEPGFGWLGSVGKPLA